MRRLPAAVFAAAMLFSIGHPARAALEGGYVGGPAAYAAGGRTVQLLWLRSPKDGRRFAVEVDSDTVLLDYGASRGVSGPEAINALLCRDRYVALALSARRPTFARIGTGADDPPVEGVAARLTVVPPPGFAALFNGKDTAGWQGLVELPQRLKMQSDPAKLAAAHKAANERILPHWTAVEGVLHYDGKANSLQTAKDYGDFELWVDYRIGPHGDSGIYLRGSPQVQIWDPADRKEGSGGLYNNQKNPRNPHKCADRPTGQWNTLRIVMRGEKVSVSLNGELVVDGVTMENYWNRALPIYPAGPIELQHHGNPLAFKNIFVREL